MTSASGGGKDTLGPEVRLTDWDVVSLLHGAQRPYNPLSAQSRGLMIKDKLTEIEEILEEFLDHSAIMVGSCWSAMAKKLDVRTAQTPHGTSSFRELVAEKDALVTHTCATRKPLTSIRIGCLRLTIPCLCPFCLRFRDL